MLLSIRLALYENIPEPFRNFKIANGRVTFVVNEEFEVDLGIADDDPKARFFLIDFRFLFNNSSTVPMGIRANVERMGDDFLAKRGLEGLYNFLRAYTSYDIWYLLTY